LSDKERMRRGSELVALASSGAATMLIMLRVTDGWEQAKIRPTGSSSR
jgi:hypothetical protein